MSDLITTPARNGADAPLLSLLPALSEELARLGPDEQRLVAETLHRARFEGDGPRPPLDLVRLVHSSLKAVLGGRESAMLEDAESALGPPVVKVFEGAPFIPLPEGPELPDAPLKSLLDRRMSSHNFDSRPLESGTLATLLRTAYGIKAWERAYNLRRFPFRTAPSAGGLQPIDLYLVVNDVVDVAQGLYYFEPVRDGLVQLDTGNLRRRFARCCIFNDWIAASPVVLIMVANLDRVFWKYGPRGYRFVHADAGVLTQNLYLAGTALRLSTCAVAAYFDDLVNEFLAVDGRREFTILLFTIGHKARPMARPTPRSLTSDDSDTA